LPRPSATGIVRHVARRDDTSSSVPADPPGRFPATRWTLVERAGAGDNPDGRVALAELVRMYAPALRVHLLQLVQNDAHRADDLLQGFLADKVLEQRLIGFADPTRGRFRSFLLTALDRYVIDTHRRDTAKKRSPGTLRAIDEHEIAIDVRPDAEFDRAWAQAVVGEVVRTMRQQCEESSRPDLWDIFETRYLRPATDNIAPEPHESIAQRLNLESAHHASNLLVSAKRMFTRIFKSVVARYAVSEAEVRDEVAELWETFSHSRSPS
jgi:DNA-directed RNA polymerase specialized sigma24 family protein